MRIIAFDVGDKTIGIAVSDELLLTAQGVEVIRRTNFTGDIARIETILTQYDADVILVGFPKNMNGTVGPRGELVRKFTDDLANFSR